VKRERDFHMVLFVNRSVEVSLGYAMPKQR
jgi:hypothetical protein